ncbi:DUF6179 domain-containing protein [Thermoflavimicrobium daqui]|uniref:Uncharacterized protein n=1 Tax=Thermoflavimicrobium daqui TaxID=2137476 RepID=A0A364K428_9BACL|nr:DUF6179 domain-containing protein [Thermoflavimicrobium daqui]RAL24106.1 hypothetical protein DL897_10460 [Thermoflavimicrobium daqui]
MELANPSSIQTLVVQGKIKKSYLSKYQYTISLINEGLRTRILDIQEVYDIQSQLILILKNLIRRYTQGESSSVSFETAEGILASMMYALDAYLLQLDDPEKAIFYLKSYHIQEIYDKGIEVVRQCFEETKELYREIRVHPLDVAVEAYNMTIEESLPIFLKKYNILFDAHNTMASIDYPLAIDDMRIQGVFYIKQYLERLKMEMEFCRLFKIQDLQETLINFGRICGFDYRIELFNIFELVLNNAIFSVLSGGDASDLKISVNQYNQLASLFTLLDESQIRFAIYTAKDRLQVDLNISNPNMINYMTQCTDELVQRVIHAAKYNSLNSVIITKKEDKPKSMMVLFKEADGMSDYHFRILVEAITECHQTEDKIQLIKSNIHSVQDFVDMLNSNCLFSEEYRVLFETLGEIELAILAKMVFYEELRNGPMDFSLIVTEKEPDIEWQLHYVELIKGLSKDRIASIEEYIYDIDYEEIKFY